MTKRRFSNFEDRLERLIEGSFARLFRDNLQPREIVVQLARAIEDNILTTDDGRDTAPTDYHIHLNPDDYAALLDNTADITTMLKKQVIAHCQESDLYLLGKLDVILEADAQVAPHQLHIQATHATTKHETTQLLEPVSLKKTKESDWAFLIVDGQRRLPIQKPRFNVGRHPDNDLVLSDLRISRHHFQLRRQHNKHILVDSESRGGTFVNGERVTEHMLQSGDVIRIGNVTILYLEEHSLGRKLTDTQHDMLPPHLPGEDAS